MRWLIELIDTLDIDVVTPKVWYIGFWVVVFIAARLFLVNPIIHAIRNR